MVLGILGFLGFLVCLVAIIICAIKKSPNLKKWAIGLAVCFVAFVIGVSISSGGNSSQTAAGTTAKQEVKQEESKPSEQAEQPKQEEKPKTEVYKIGDSVETGQAIFTVNGVREDNGNDFIKPKEGNIYYLVDVTVENKSDSSLAVSSLLMFKLVDSEGYSYNITIGPETKGQLDGEIGAGRKLRGELAYEIPKDAKGLELEIDPSIWSFGKIVFKLDR